MAEPRYSTTCPCPPAVPMRAMIPRIMSLAVTPVARSPSMVMAIDRGPGLGQGLGGEDMLHLGCADSERQGAERSVGGGVGVAADDGHPRLGRSLLGSDHMDDPLARIIQAVEGDPELPAIGDQGVDLALGQRVPDGQSPSGGGHAVVDGGQSQVRSAHRPSGQPEPIESLRRGDLVDEVQVDVEQGRFALDLPHQMAVPYLFEQGLWRGFELR